MERMPSIFNDVLSPVTPGPSSSNTCGPYRIARLARALLGEPPRRITVRMARRGGYYDTFYSMHSHEAILAALLGQELLRCDLSTMCRQADEAGLCYDFQFVDDLPVRPSELAEMDLSGDRRTIRLTGVSLGGGEIEITRLNGSDILLRGKRRETVCLGPEGARVVPENAAAAEEFMAKVDAAAVYHNASTRFTDGGEFGFGAEIGISTQKLHARGPMGLAEMTTYKYLIAGDGQVR